jgi:hypothetical protein
VFQKAAATAGSLTPQNQGIGRLLPRDPVKNDFTDGMIFLRIIGEAR